MPLDKKEKRSKPNPTSNITNNSKEKKMNENHNPIPAQHVLSILKTCT
jgi:hypothetical protein